MIIPYGIVLSDEISTDIDDTIVLSSNPLDNYIASFSRHGIKLHGNNYLDQLASYDFKNFTASSAVMCCAWSQTGKQLIINPGDYEATIFYVKQTEEYDSLIPLIGYLVPSVTITLAYRLSVKTTISTTKFGKIQSLYGSLKRLYIGLDSGNILIYNFNGIKLNYLELEYGPVSKIFSSPEDKYLFLLNSEHTFYSVLPTGDELHPWISSQTELLLIDVYNVDVNLDTNTITIATVSNEINLYNIKEEEGKVNLIFHNKMDNLILSDIVGNIEIMSWNFSQDILYISDSINRFFLFNNANDLIYSPNYEGEEGNAVAWNSNDLYILTKNILYLLNVVHYPRDGLPVSLKSKKDIVMFNSEEKSWVSIDIPNDIIENDIKIISHCISELYVVMISLNCIYSNCLKNNEWQEIDLNGFNIICISIYDQTSLVLIRESKGIQELVMYNLEKGKALVPLIIKKLDSGSIIEIKIESNLISCLDSTNYVYLHKIIKTGESVDIDLVEKISVVETYSHIPYYYNGTHYIFGLSSNLELYSISDKETNPTILFTNLTSFYLINTSNLLPEPYHVALLVHTINGFSVLFPFSECNSVTILNSTFSFNTSDYPLIGLDEENFNYLFVHCISDYSNEDCFSINFDTTCKSYLSDLAATVLLFHTDLFKEFMKNIIEKEVDLDLFIPRTLYLLFSYCESTSKKILGMLAAIKQEIDKFPQLYTSCVHSIKQIDIKYHNLVYSLIGEPIQIFNHFFNLNDIENMIGIVSLLECSANSGKQIAFEKILKIKYNEKRLQIDNTKCYCLNNCLLLYIKCIENRKYDPLTDLYNYIKREHKSEESMCLFDLSLIMEEINLFLSRNAFLSNDFILFKKILSLDYIPVASDFNISLEDSKAVLEQIKYCFVENVEKTNLVDGKEEKIKTISLDLEELKSFYSLLIDFELFDLALLVAILLKNKEYCHTLEPKVPELYKHILIE